jgi:hypothetical protein
VREKWRRGVDKLSVAETYRPSPSGLGRETGKPPRRLNEAV